MAKERYRVTTGACQMSAEPLSSLHVVDFTTMTSGGVAAATFPDFGANVISVEHPTTPDPSRRSAPQSTSNRSPGGP